MDLQEICRKTQLPLRKLRYVLDQGILPGTRVETDSQRWGHPRSFTDFEGFSIAVAAALLEGGLRRELVVQFFDKMVGTKWGKIGRYRRDEGPLLFAFQLGVTPCKAEIADGRYLAVTIGRRALSWLDLESTKDSLVDHRPTVLVSLDLARLRDAIWGK